MSAPVNIVSVGTPWRKALAANSSTAYGNDTAKTTKTKPATTTGMLVVDLAEQEAPGAAVPNRLMLKLFGTGSDDQTVKARVWGIAPVEGTRTSQTGDGQVTYEWVLLADWLGTMTTSRVGLAGSGSILATDNETDTIAVTSGNDDVDLSFNSPTSNIRGAWCETDLKGFDIFAVELAPGTGTDANALYRLL